VKNALTQHNRVHNPITHYPNPNESSSSSSSTKSFSVPSNIIPYRFDILISFYEKKEVKEYMGLLTRIENSYFESWRIPVSIVDYPLPMTPFTKRANPKPSDLNEYNDQYRLAYDCVANSIMSIIEVSS
jgi:superfamily I DNA/RNA helicase